MPELPDVEVFKQYLDSTSLHQTIRHVDVSNSKVLENTSAQVFKNQLKDCQFQSSSRQGKYLFVELSSGEWLVFSFGMTGSLKYFKNDDQMPDYPRIRFDFVNEFHLVYASQRMLGKVMLTGDRKQFIEAHQLGLDAISPDLDESRFRQVMKGRRGMLKSTLMNQHVIAGIGNVYADEILFHAGFHPKTSVKELDDNHFDTLFRAMQEVLQVAIAHRADPEQLPNSYLLPHRHDGGKCPKCGESLQHIKVSGRTAYYCPQCQPKP
ncbi:MAG: Fpg/Nei family DNA glycosylase [Elainellaceae cyanobacterium]